MYEANIVLNLFLDVMQMRPKVAGIQKVNLNSIHKAKI